MQAEENSIFSVEPFSAEVPAEESLELTITAYLDDALKFTDKMNILIERGVNFTVSLSAQGKGTTIVCDPPLMPSINLGTFFSRGHCHREVQLTNKGRRVQALSWVTDGFSATRVKKVEMDRRSRDMADIKIKQLIHHRPQPEVVPKKPMFHIIPEKFVLEPQESCVVFLKGHCDR